MAEMIGEFRCEACRIDFKSLQELDRHNSKMRDPQPTLPSLEQVLEVRAAD